MKKKLLTLGSVIFALGLLTGCGGGGSSAAAPGSTPEEELRQQQLLLREETTKEVEAISRKAAENGPNRGSVTQSSNGVDDTVSADFDRREVDSFTYNIDLDSTSGTSFTVAGTAESYVYTVGNSDGSFSPVSVFVPLPSEGDFENYRLISVVGDGTVDIVFFTDIEAPQTIPSETTELVVSAAVESALPPNIDSVSTFVGTYGGVPGTFTCSEGCASIFDDSGVVTASIGTREVTFSSDERTEYDTNWLAGGVWLYSPDGETASVEIGAFADGGEPFPYNDIAGLSGTASYTGKATGIHSKVARREPRVTDYGFFTADVRLDADFDNDKVSGMVFNFEVPAYSGGSSTGQRNLEIILGEADIERGPSSGSFFNGAIGNEEVEVNIGGDTYTNTVWAHDGEGRYYNDPETGETIPVEYSGHWGGQFFGVPSSEDPDGSPTSAAGTFAVYTEVNDNGDAESFVGAFGAHREETGAASEEL